MGGKKALPCVYEPLWFRVKKIDNITHSETLWLIISIPYKSCKCVVHLLPMHKSAAILFSYSQFQEKARKIWWNGKVWESIGQCSIHKLRSPWTNYLRHLDQDFVKSVWRTLVLCVVDKDISHCSSSWQLLTIMWKNHIGWRLLHWNKYLFCLYITSSSSRRFPSCPVPKCWGELHLFLSASYHPCIIGTFWKPESSLNSKALS